MEGDPEALRKEAARPDGVILLNPGGSEKFKYETRTDLAAGHLGLLQEAKNEIDLMGPNATQMGDKAGGSVAASGKAIIASQTGGMIELGDLQMRCVTSTCGCGARFGTASASSGTRRSGIKVTDDEKNLRWVAFNVPPDQLEMLRAQNPQMAGRLAHRSATSPSLDCDITIEDAPDTVTPALEQWTALIELAGGGVPIPPDVLIEAAPNLKNKGKILERMSQPNPAQEQAQKSRLRAKRRRSRKPSPRPSRTRQTRTHRRCRTCSRCRNSAAGRPETAERFDCLRATCPLKRRLRPRRRGYLCDAGRAALCDGSGAATRSGTGSRPAAAGRVRNSRRRA